MAASHAMVANIRNPLRARHRAALALSVHLDNTAGTDRLPPISVGDVLLR